MGRRYVPCFAIRSPLWGAPYSRSTTQRYRNPLARQFLPQKPQALKFEKQEHNIEKQIINLAVEGDLEESKIKELQSAIVYLYKHKIGEILDQVFSELVPPDVHVVINKIVVDLPTINISDLENMRDLSRKIESVFKSKARNIIREKILKANKDKFEKDGFGNIRVSKWAILERFLEDGHYPSWADTKNQSIDKIFDELMRKSPERVAALVLKLSKKNKRLLDRIIYQLPTQQIERLISSIYERYGATAIKQLRTIRRRLGKRYRAMRGQKSVDKAILSAAMEYALDQVRKGKRVSYKEQAFIQKIIEAIQSKYTHVADEDIIYRSDGVKPEHSKQYSDLDVLEYFLQYGSIPYWASADSRSSIHALFDRLTNKRLVPLQRMLLKHAQDENFMRRLVLQFNDQQIFQLLEPIPDDQLRFLKGMLREFQSFANKLVGLSSNQGQQAVKEAALEYMLNRSGRFSKEALTRLAIEKATSLARAPFQEGLELFFGHLQQASSQRYDLTRSELLRAIYEINPDLSEKLEQQLQERRVLQTEEEELLQQLRTLQSQIKAEQLPLPDIKRLKRERKSLRKRLQKLRQRLDQLGAAAPESARSLGVQKIELERKISQLSRQLQAEEQLLENQDAALQEKEEEQKKKLKSLADERQRLKQELSTTKKSLKRLQRKLLRDYEKAKTPQQREKLLAEFESLLASLQSDQNRLQIRLTETQTGLTESRINKAAERRLKRQEKRISEELQKLAEDIQELEKVVQEIQAELTKEAEEEALDSPSSTSQMDFLVFFLQYGSVPWWAEEYRKRSIEDIIQEFAEKFPEKLRQAFARLGRNPVVWQRLVNQLSAETLEQVLVLLFPNFAGFAISAAIMLEKIKAAQIIPSLQKIDDRYFKWSKVTELLFTGTARQSASDFIKELVIEVGKAFNIAPSQLLEYMKNLAANNPGTRLSFFGDIIAPLTEDEELLAAEKALLEAVFRKQQEEAGLILKEEQRLETLKAYIQKGVYTDAAVKAKYNSKRAMERLLLELLAEQPDAVRALIEEQLGNAQMRSRLIMEMQNSSFWEIILLIAPQTMPLVQRYIQELGKALSDSNMFMAKEVLLRFIMQLDAKPFSIRDYLQAFLDTATRATQRNKVAIINEWKRKLYGSGDMQSSLILMLMQAEIQDIKEQKDNTKDESEIENLNASLQALQIEYQQQNRSMIYILNREQVEAEGLPNAPANPKELYERIANTAEELQNLRDSIKEDAVGEELIRQIMTWRQIAQLEGQLNLLKQQEPFSVRHLRTEQSRLKTELQQMQEELQSLKIPSAKPLPELPDPTEVELLTARQLDGEGEVIETPDSSTLLDEEALAFLRQIENLGIQSLAGLWEDFKASSGLSDDLGNYLYRRVLARLRVLIAQDLQKVVQQERTLIQNIEKASTPEELEAIRRKLLTQELAQNDQIDRLLDAQWDANIKAELQRSKTRVRAVFQYLRALIEQRNKALAEARKAELENQIKTNEVGIESLEKEEEQLLEHLKKGGEESELPSTLQPEVEQKAPKAADKPVDEPLYVRNAGMVLLHAYYTRLFMALKMIDKGKFVSEEAQIRAVHMLQYIVTGQTSHPENELVLNKIMCGLPLSTPVPMDVGLTEEELKTCDSLLQGAINNWPRLKTMSPDALRGTFLVRDGSIEEEADRWKLKVEKGSFDMLLRTIPWGFTFIRYGWLDKFIMVEWEIPG